MSRIKQFLLQTIFIFSVALIPSLFVIRIFQPVEAVARADSIFHNGARPDFLNPLISREGSVDANLTVKQVKVSPSLISLPEKGVNLPVASGEIVEDKWTLYEDKVAWLSTSSEPGEGNVILYAHNQKHLFRPLHELVIGDEVMLEHGGWEYLYKVTEIKKVNPTDVAAVLSSEEQLTLYTCDGVFDQRRLVVIAKPISSI
jgi:LPXTG-site transpeptidase (sortase) family protein